MKKTLLFLLIFLMLSNFVSARHSDEFVQDFSEVLNETCQGEDLEISEGLVENTITNEKITFVEKSEWNFNLIKRFIEIFEDYIYVEYTMIPCDGAGSMGPGGAMAGCGILRCGDNVVDISGDEYYINDIKFETAKERTTNIIYKNVYKSLVNVGVFELTLFKFSFALVSISIIGIALILRILFSFKKEFSFKFLSKKYFFKMEKK